MADSEFLVLFKVLLTRIGTILPEDYITRTNACLNHLESGRWFKQMSLSIPKPMRDREEVYGKIASRIANERVLYLEFGVWEGASLRYWSKALENPAAALHAFDGFEGLPEDWSRKCPKGSFSSDGKIPQIDDPRVKFFVGWFSDTLPSYQPPPHDVLFINIDSDLYSSAATVLNALGRHIGVGSFIYFDEFADRLAEQKAFREYLTETGQRFEVIATDRCMEHIAFRRIA